MERDIKGEILAASFWANWAFYKEQCRMNSSMKDQLRVEVEKIRKDWIDHQKGKINEVPRLSGI